MLQNQNNNNLRSQKQTLSDQKIQPQYQQAKQGSLFNQLNIINRYSEMQFQDQNDPIIQQSIYDDNVITIPKKDYQAFKIIHNSSHYQLPKIEVIKPLNHSNAVKSKYKIYKQTVRNNFFQKMAQHLSSPYVIIALVIFFFLFMKGQRNKAMKNNLRRGDIDSGSFGRGNRNSKGKYKSNSRRGNNKPMSMNSRVQRNTRIMNDNHMISRYQGMKNVSYKGQWQDSDSQDQDNALQDQVYQNYRD